MPPVTIPAAITLGRVGRDVLAPTRLRRVKARLARQNENLEHDDWRIERVRRSLASRSGAALAKWSMPIQARDFYGEPRPYDIDHFLFSHVYVAKRSLRTALAVWETPEELHWLFDTIQRVTGHPFFEAQRAMFMPALKLFELTPGEDRFFFYSFIDDGE